MLRHKPIKKILIQIYQLRKFKRILLVCKGYMEWGGMWWCLPEGYALGAAPGKYITYPQGTGKWNAYFSHVRFLNEKLLNWFFRDVYPQDPRIVRGWILKYGNCQFMWSSQTVVLPERDERLRGRSILNVKAEQLWKLFWNFHCDRFLCQSSH